MPPSQRAPSSQSRFRARPIPLIAVTIGEGSYTGALGLRAAVDLLPAFRVAVLDAPLAAVLLPPRVPPEPDPRAGVRPVVDPVPVRGVARVPERESGRAEAEVFPAMGPRYPVSHTNHIRHTVPAGTAFPPAPGDKTR